MLAKRMRLGAEEVAAVLARGKTIGRGKVLSLKMLDAPAPFRSAVVISKKVAKSAVKRNALRRSAYRALRATSLPQAGHAILFIQSLPQEKPFETFVTDLKKLFNV